MREHEGKKICMDCKIRLNKSKAKGDAKTLGKFGKEAGLEYKDG